MSFILVTHNNNSWYIRLITDFVTGIYVDLYRKLTVNANPDLPFPCKTGAKMAGQQTQCLTLLTSSRELASLSFCLLTNDKNWYLARMKSDLLGL